MKLWSYLFLPCLLQAQAVTGLRCEYLANPAGIDVPDPRLSWALSSPARGAKQTAYRILAASGEAALRAGKGDLWDSGRVPSDQSAHVVYKGKPLTSGMTVFWKVQVWDESGKPLPWSAAARWSMGLLQPGDWKGKWIGRDEDTLYKDPASPYWNLAKSRWIWFPEGNPAVEAPPGTRLFRTAINVPTGRKVREAVAIVGADSRFELYVNGVNLARGNTVQMPAAVDIAQHLRPGRNTIAVLAAHAGKGKPAGFIGAIRLDFDSGEPLVVNSGAAWHALDKQPAGWEQANFDDAAWPAAKDLGPYGMAPWGDVGFIGERALPARMLRKEFDAKARVRRATAYVSGLGLFELFVNGARAGDQVLSPNLTEYDKRVFYVTFDVTSYLAAGRNAIGLLLGNGRYWAPREAAPIASRSFGYPKAVVQLDIEYADGSRASIASDESWKLTTRGPIRANNEFDGEDYDARMEMPGWSRAGFNDAGWEPARAVAAPSGGLVAQMAEPLRVVETIRPVKVTELRPGVHVFDMGQNMVGWCRLRVAGPKGTRISLRHAETLRDDGTLYVDNLRSARANDFYTLKGGGAEVWEPRFTYHGFRYVEVKGFPGKPSLAALEGRVVHDDMARTADFESSNALFNRIHRNIFWGVRGNYRSIPTDCPQRDERQGWLGDRSQVSRGESYLFDIAAFYSKFATDMADSQRPTGSIPNVAPAYWVLYSDNVTWPSTFIYVPGMLYDQYGDLRAIERNYAPMKKWIDYMRGFLQDGLMPRDTYGDWCVPPESPQLIHSQDPARKTNGTLLGTAYYYDLLRVMARYARLLEKAQDAAAFEQLAAQVKDAFNRKFFNPKAGFYGNGTQTSSILPLHFGLAPEADRKTVFARLIEKIEKESRGHVGTGLVGAQWLMRALSDNGRPDIAFTIANQKTYPGWGYMIEKGATTIWELWNGDTADPAMNSGNHVMQIGDLGVWFYEYLAGIRSDPARPGFKHVIVKPYPVGDLTFVKASHRSLYGTVASRWKREGSRLQLNATIPANTSATVYVPAKDGTKVSAPPGARFLRHEPGRAVYETPAGTYSFASEM